MSLKARRPKPGSRASNTTTCNSSAFGEERSVVASAIALEPCGFRHLVLEPPLGRILDRALGRLETVEPCVVRRAHAVHRGSLRGVAGRDILAHAFRFALQRR